MNSSSASPEDWLYGPRPEHFDDRTGSKPQLLLDCGAFANPPPSDCTRARGGLPWWMISVSIKCSVSPGKNDGSVLSRARITRTGMIFNWVPDRILFIFIAEPEHNAVTALTLGNGDRVFRLNHKRTFTAPELNTPVDHTPTVPEVIPASPATRRLRATPISTSPTAATARTTRHGGSRQTSPSRPSCCPVQEPYKLTWRPWRVGSQ